MTRDPLAELVAGLATTPPPARPPCAGADPHLFDATTVETAADAMAICAGCRADVVSWCRSTVNPVPSRFDGVCAGQVWRGGRTVEMTPSLLAGLLLESEAS